MSPLKLPVRLTSNRRKKDENKQEKTLEFWVGGAITSLLFILLIQWLWPNTIPFGTFDFWKKNNILAGIFASWPIFAWGWGITTLVAFTTLNKKSLNHKAEELLVGGVIASVIAGVFEEIIFRWTLFLSGIIGVKVGNWLIFGWLGFGLAEWLHMNIFGPVVNFVTLGKMHWLIYDMGWAVGAGALAANAKFRKGHRYLGWFGLINSWIIGFFLFWVMFKYGLLTAIIVHFLYDLFIFVIRYVDAAIERHFGWGTDG